MYRKARNIQVLVTAMTLGIWAACSPADGGTDGRTSEDVARDVAAGEVLPDDVPRSDLPPADAPGSDLPQADLPRADVPSTEVPLADVPSTEVRPDDLPPTDESPADASEGPTLHVTASGALTEVVGFVANGTTLSFAPGGGSVDLLFGNSGGAPLQIREIKVTSTNAGMGLLPSLEGISWPRTVAPGQVQPSDPTVLKLRVVLDPGSDDRKTLTLQVTTSDSSLPGGVFTFSLASPSLAPSLQVDPPNLVFLGATASTPDQADIVLTNVGGEPLAFSNAYFEHVSPAYSLIGGPPNKDSILDPAGTGTGGDSRRLTVRYSPAEPPDAERLVIEWGPVLTTGVTCFMDGNCQGDQELCGIPGRACPYTCVLGRCACHSDEDCAAYQCDAGEPCDAVCLTGVCRVPQRTYVDLRGVSEAPELKVDYADRLTGCMDFSAITEVGATCTKRVALSTVGQGVVKITRPTTHVGMDLVNPYQVEWYRAGASQAEDCGPVTGEVLAGNVFALTEQNSPITLAVTYTAPGAKAANGELVIPYQSPHAGQEIVALCGGFRKGELGVAPPPQAQSNVVMFGQEPTRKATKTVVLMNKGNDVLQVKAVSVAPVNPGVDPEGFKILNPPSAADLQMLPGALLPLTIEFDGNVFELDENSEAVVLNGLLDIDYVDPLEGGEARESVNLVGWVNVKGVVLPVANAGSSSDHAGARVGTPILLDGTASVGGTFPIEASSGYTWFLSAKPATSRIFTNPGPGPAQLSVIPDVAGEYEFRLVVYSYDLDSRLSFFSDESVLRIVVGP